MDLDRGRTIQEDREWWMLLGEQRLLEKLMSDLRNARDWSTGEWINVQHARIIGLLAKEVGSYLNDHRSLRP